MFLYHGTNIDTEYLLKPLWLTPDYHLTGHFALNAKGNTLRLEIGYIYKLDVNNENLTEIDNRIYILNDGDIKIIEKTKVVFDRLVGFKRL